MPFDKAQPAYRALRSIVGERTSSVVIWVGSGLSAAAGLPTWPGLKKHLLQSLLEKSESLESVDRDKLYSQYLAIKDETDYWLAFQRLKQQLGPTSYRHSVRECLSPAVRVGVPESYANLWKLNPKGVINLNLDRLATRAYLENVKGAPPIEFSGVNLANFFHVIKSPQSFILNLHGIHEDASTWVLTREELVAVAKREAFKYFVRTCLLTSTVVFTGVSVDDIAIRSHLEELSSAEIDWGAHYWITPRSDYGTDQWAEELGVRVVRYEATAGDHSALDEVFDDLSTYTPSEDEAAPVVASMGLEGTPAPEPRELAGCTAEEIRQVLNSLAQRILAVGNEESYKEFASFCEKYDEAIYRAWYTSTREGKNILLGYVLLDEIATGAFGRVYRATDEDGRQVAVKVLREEIRRTQESLQSFRRGVKSMRILQGHSFRGMVKFLEASEIPTFVVMEFIEGPTLREAVKAHQVGDWELVLRIGENLSNVIRRAHSVPERVLHRDLRPSNIMLRNYWSDPDRWELLVLDFDLSWHRGAYEVSIMHGESSVGYMAPEQIRREASVSTRHAAVDSFGLGMTLFYLVSGRDPVPEEHQHRDWVKGLQEITSSLPKPRWHSVPRRYARLIESATRHEQAKRWDVGQIEGELSRLRAALVEPSGVDSAELVAEELASRTDYGEAYEWDSDSLSARVILPSGLTIVIRGDETSRMLRLTVRWTSSGLEDRKRVGKWLPSRAEKATALLEKEGWKEKSENLGIRDFALECERSIEGASKILDTLARTVDEVARILSFS